jgi:hypothetical protein
MGAHTSGGRATGAPAVAASSRTRHAAWLAGLFVIAFLTPYLLADTLEIQRDVYYALYGGIAITFAWAWGRATEQSWYQMIARRWRLTLLLAVIGGAVLIPAAMRAEDAGERADGFALVGQLLWRGAFYGAVDGFVLAALPILIVYATFDHARFSTRSLAQKAGIVGAAFAATLAMTTVYHLGYSDFRSEKVTKPLIGNPLWSIPTLATANPIGAPIAHATLHVTAVLRNEDSDTFLPPHY